MLAQDTATLNAVARLSSEKILNPVALRYGVIRADAPVLVVLAAGKGTRFGSAPKCIQPVGGVPLARHSINGFHELSPAPAVCLVGYRHEEVSAALGYDNVHVLSDNPTGGTAYAAYEAFCVAELERVNPILLITMGDRIVTASVFRRLYETHCLGSREADITLLTAIYEPPKNQGKGRVVRDALRKVTGIIEQRDIDELPDPETRQALLDTTEGNCPLYAIRASTLRRYLSRVDNRNAQGQFYFTDIIAAIHRDHGEIRTITTTPADPEYDLLCSDVTRPMDLALLEGVLSRAGIPLADSTNLDDVAAALAHDRPAGQIASIAAQLEELADSAPASGLDLRPDEPIGLGVSGGRLRIAFMHPDMGRFYGPAWQMPIGAATSEGREQVVVLMQSADDGKIRLHTTNPLFREKIDYVAADEASMYPGAEVADWYTYEGFGTRMAENLLLSLGYFTNEEVAARRAQGRPLPPPSLWVSNNLRRPFSLLGNALASLRTLRDGNLGARVQAALDRGRFRGLRVMSTGNLPQGGFSSSSAVTVAVKNSINALFDFGIGPDLLVQLACQAEYGTGVRAGALDQATEQKGRYSQGALISSNPRENYRILGAYPVPADRFRVLFPYSVDRDREAWKWSAGVYAESSLPQRLTAPEIRKMTGKAAEIAALLTQLPLERDFFQEVEADLIATGELSPERHAWVNQTLLRLPLRISHDELRERLFEQRPWYIEQLMDQRRLSADAATHSADVTLDALLAGWRDPLLRRATLAGDVVEEVGVPLRAMVAYLFAEVAKNCYLMHHPNDWIASVTRSQQGDRCFDVPRDALPSRAQLESELSWEQSTAGPRRMERWLEACRATPFDFNRGLSDDDLRRSDSTPWRLVPGTNFFRGLALIDLAEAFLKRAFGAEAIALRVNAAGQGDYFQVHVDTERADPEEVKRFLRQAFYRRFELRPAQEFVEPHPGGGAVGVRLHRLRDLPELVRRLRGVAAAQGR